MQKPNVEAEVCDKNVTKEREKGKKKKLKSLIGFLYANKIDNYNRGQREKKIKYLKESIE